jgi:4-amino-4-deoxy-L-arabinose transferase-like glycosyltransferase
MSRLPSKVSLIHAVLLLAMALPYCINLGASSIWDANEAFYAETPREMLETGLYISPLFNYRWRIEKPPLTYYAILLSYKVFGVNEFAVRFPGALAALGVILFSYACSRRLFGPRAAIISAAISATTMRIFVLARRLPIDILLLFFLTGVLYFLVRGIQKKDRISWLFAYLLCALGFLTKGPVAVVIPAGAFILWKLWNRRSDISIYPIEGCLIFAFIVLPWYALVYLEQGWNYIAPFFLMDNLGRFAAKSYGPSRGYFYYFSVFLTDFIPWSLLALAALCLLWRTRKELHPLKSLSFGLPLIWCVFIFCLFSLSKNKQEYYIAPLYPAAAIIISGILDKSIPRRSPGAPDEQSLAVSVPETMPGTSTIQRGRCWDWCYGLIALFLFAASLPLPLLLTSFMPGASFVLLYSPSLILVAGAALMAWSILRRTIAHCFPALAASLGAVFLFGALFYIPALEAVRPVKNFCKRIAMQLHEHDEAGYYRAAAPSMVYYLRRPIFEESDDKRMTGRFRSNKRVFCIIAEKHYSYFTHKGVQLFILDRHSPFAIRLGSMLDSGRSSGDDLLLVCNQPPVHSEP